MTERARDAQGSPSRARCASCPKRAGQEEVRGDIIRFDPVLRKWLHTLNYWYGHEAVPE